MMTEETRRIFSQLHIQEWMAARRKERPDAVFYQNIDAAFGYVAGWVCVISDNEAAFRGWMTWPTGNDAGCNHARDQHRMYEPEDSGAAGSVGAAVGNEAGAEAKGSASVEPTQPAAPTKIVCVCGQERVHSISDGMALCGDCYAMKVERKRSQTIDTRIAAARVDADPASDWSAWAHPGSEGP